MAADETLRLAGLGEKGPAIAIIPKVAQRVHLTVYCPFDGWENCSPSVLLSSLQFLPPSKDIYMHAGELTRHPQTKEGRMGSQHQLT